MSDAEIYWPRQVPVHAMKFTLGVTTKSEILAFCPGANVGAPLEEERDIRWILLPTAVREYVVDGDWIVRLDDGAWKVMSDDEFTRRYQKGRGDLELTNAVLQEAADTIAGLAPYGVELRPDGSEDPLTSAWVEGLREAHTAVRALGLDKRMHGDTPRPEQVVKAEALPLDTLDAIVGHLMRDGSREGLIHANALNAAFGRSARRRADRIERGGA